MGYEINRPMLYNGTWRQPGEPFDPSGCHNLRVLLNTRYVKKVPDKQAPPPSPPSDIGKEEKATGDILKDPPVAPPKPPDEEVVGDKSKELDQLGEPDATKEQSNEANKQVEINDDKEVNSIPPTPPARVAPAQPVRSQLQDIAPTPKTPQKRVPYTANLPKKG